MTRPQVPCWTQEGPTMSKRGSSWNLVPLPALKGVEGCVESSGIRLGRGTNYLLGPAFKPNHKLVSSHLKHPRCWNKPWATLDSLDSPRPGLGGSDHLPPYSILCVTPPRPHSNGSLSRDSQSGVPKLSRFGLLGLWAFITSCSNLQLGWGLKRTCSSPWELFNDVLHSTCTYQDRVDSWLLVVGSQIASLTPGLSFNHKLCCWCPNGSCEAISDI